MFSKAGQYLVQSQCDPKLPLGEQFLPPASALLTRSEVIESVPCVCLSVCPLVSALTAKRIDIRTWKLVEGLALMTSRTSLMAKVKGQGHQIKKRDFFIDFACLFLLDGLTKYPGLLCDIMWRYIMTSRCHLTSRDDVMTLEKDFWAKALTRTMGRGRCINVSFFWWYIIDFLKFVYSYIRPPGAGPYRYSGCVPLF